MLMGAGTGTNPHTIGAATLSVVLTSADLSGAGLFGWYCFLLNFSVFCRFFFEGKV